MYTKIKFVWSTSQPVNQSTSQPVNQSTSQPVNQSTSQPVNQSTTFGHWALCLPFFFNLL